MVSLVACMLITAATAQLSGKVVDESGTPVADAIVVVSTARPKVGPATTCPTCYRDCNKRARTNDRGEFKIDGLSDALQFTLAAGAPGYQGLSSEFYDPAENPDVQLKLKPQFVLTGSAQIQGSVTDQAGKPIAGAEIRLRNLHRDDGRIGGADASVTSLTLTNEEGKFEICVGGHIQAFDLRAVATGFAPNEIHWSRSDPEPLRVTLGPGASFHGKLVYKGHPVPSVEIGLVQKNRVLGNIVTPQEVYTDASGMFHFEHLPPDFEYTIYTHTGQDAPAVLPVTIVEAPAHGQRADLGEIQLATASRLTITVRTDDGSRLPKDSYLMISRDDAWRGSKVVLGRQRSFTAEISDVSDETYKIFIRVPGYKVSTTHPQTNLDMNRRYEITVHGDTTLEFRMESINPVQRPTLPAAAI